MEEFITVNGIKIKRISIKYYELDCKYSNFKTLGEGTTRFVYDNQIENPDSIYKREIWHEESFHNEKELRLYCENCNICTFLAKVKGVSDDREVIEMEKLNTKPIEEIARKIGIAKVDTIFDIISECQELGGQIDFRWEEVDNFIFENCLDENEIYFWKNWGLDSNNKLRLLDYSR